MTDRLSESEIAEIAASLKAGKPLHPRWRAKLFPEATEVEVGKEYRIAYAGKIKQEEILADTPAAPWQLVRRFCADKPFDDGWTNLLVFG